MTWQHDNKQYKQVNYKKKTIIEKIVSIFKLVLFHILFCFRETNFTE